MVDFAEWLYKNGEPVEDVEDVLLSAADSILSIERGPSEADDAVAGSDARSVVSYRSGISRSSSKSKGTNRTAKTAKSARTAKTAKTNATKKSAKSTKSGAAGADDVKPPQYLTIRHMRLAVRIFLSLSDIASTHAGTMENLLLAHHYGVRMMKVRSPLARTTLCVRLFVIPSYIHKQGCGWPTHTKNKQSGRGLTGRVALCRRFQAHWAPRGGTTAS